MVYRVIGLMSGSSLDGLDIVFTELEETGGKWSYAIQAANCYEYNVEWKSNLEKATSLSAKEYALLHTAYGNFLGHQVNRFIEENNLHHKVQLIVSHGHTTFHDPQNKTSCQLGDGAAIAAETEINVVNDLRAMDVAFGGQGAPIVPIGEKLLFSDYEFCLNIGGIANLSYKSENGYIAFDVCAANRVLNMLAIAKGVEYDDGGNFASKGNINTPMLTQLNSLDYYGLQFPKSLPNSFGTEVVWGIIETFDISVEDKLRTYVEHIVMQIGYSIQKLMEGNSFQNSKLLVTGGGALNSFLVNRLQQLLSGYNIETVVPDAMLINYKEALVMALIGVLRWREEYNVLHTVTGARRSSIGGAVWIGQEA